MSLGSAPAEPPRRKKKLMTIPTCFIGQDLIPCASSSKTSYKTRYFDSPSRELESDDSDVTLDGNSRSPLRSRCASNSPGRNAFPRIAKIASGQASSRPSEGESELESTQERSLISSPSQTQSSRNSSPDKVSPKKTPNYRVMPPYSKSKPVNLQLKSSFNRGLMTTKEKGALKPDIIVPRELPPELRKLEETRLYKEAAARAKANGRAFVENRENIQISSTFWRTRSRVNRTGVVEYLLLDSDDEISSCEGSGSVPRRSTQRDHGKMKSSNSTPSSSQPGARSPIPSITPSSSQPGAIPSHAPRISQQRVQLAEDDCMIVGSFQGTPRSRRRRIMTKKSTSTVIDCIDLDDDLWEIKEELSVRTTQAVCSPRSTNSPTKNDVASAGNRIRCKPMANLLKHPVPDVSLIVCPDRDCPGLQAPDRQGTANKSSLAVPISRSPSLIPQAVGDSLVVPQTVGDSLTIPIHVSPTLVPNTGGGSLALPSHGSPTLVPQTVGDSLTIPIHGSPTLVPQTVGGSSVNPPNRPKPQVPGSLSDPGSNRLCSTLAHAASSSPLATASTMQPESDSDSLPSQAASQPGHQTAKPLEGRMQPSFSSQSDPFYDALEEQLATQETHVDSFEFVENHDSCSNNELLNASQEFPDDPLMITEDKFKLEVCSYLVDCKPDAELSRLLQDYGLSEEHDVKPPLDEMDVEGGPSSFSQHPSTSAVDMEMDGAGGPSGFSQHPSTSAVDMEMDGAGGPSGFSQHSSTSAVDMEMDGAGGPSGFSQHPSTIAIDTEMEVFSPQMRQIENPTETCAQEPHSACTQEFPSICHGELSTEVSVTNSLLQIENLPSTHSNTIVRNPSNGEVELTAASPETCNEAGDQVTQAQARYKLRAAICSADQGPSNASVTTGSAATHPPQPCSDLDLCMSDTDTELTMASQPTHGSTSQDPVGPKKTLRNAATQSLDNTSRHCSNPNLGHPTSAMDSQPSVAEELLNANPRLIDIACQTDFTPKVKFEIGLVVDLVSSDDDDEIVESSQKSSSNVSTYQSSFLRELSLCRTPPNDKSASPRTVLRETRAMRRDRLDERERNHPSPKVQKGKAPTTIGRFRTAAFRQACDFFLKISPKRYQPSKPKANVEPECERDTASPSLLSPPDESPAKSPHDASSQEEGSPSLLKRPVCDELFVVPESKTSTQESDNLDAELQPRKLRFDDEVMTTVPVPNTSVQSSSVDDDSSNTKKSASSTHLESRVINDCEVGLPLEDSTVVNIIQSSSAVERIEVADTLATKSSTQHVSTVANRDKDGNISEVQAIQKKVEATTAAERTKTTDNVTSVPVSLNHHVRKDTDVDEEKKTSEAKRLQKIDKVHKKTIIKANEENQVAHTKVSVNDKPSTSKVIHWEKDNGVSCQAKAAATRPIIEVCNNGNPSVYDESEDSEPLLPEDVASEATVAPSELSPAKRAIKRKKKDRNRQRAMRVVECAPSPVASSSKAPDDAAGFYSRLRGVDKLPKKRISRSDNETTSEDDEVVDGTPAKHGARAARGHRAWISTLEMVQPVTSSVAVPKGEHKPRHVRKQLVKIAKPRQPYGPDEVIAIVAYIEENNLQLDVSGRMMWENMEAESVCPGRTWQSLKEHFIKKILPNIKQHASDADSLKAFLAKRKARNGKSPSKPVSGSLDWKTSVAAPRSDRRRQNRREYTSAEDVKILKYILEHRRYRNVKGNKVWWKMENKELLKDRTWQSMKNRFKWIIANITRFDISEEVRKVLILNSGYMAPARNEV